MKTFLSKSFFLSCALGICLSGCNGSPFSNAQSKPNIWVSAKVEPIDKKPAVKGKNQTKNSNAANFSKFGFNSTEVNTGQTGNLWEKMAKDFQIPVPANHPAIQAQIKWFQQHQGYLDRTSKRAAPYMYLVYEQAHQRNLPSEVVLLPIIESAYYPLAYSGAGAAGLWQLMPGTASKFGLKRNWWYDGRRDIFASTNAALDYLSYLQNYFNGNWLLALAAYDAGEGTVQEAIRRNEVAGKDTDFWSLKLPQETMTYVPRMLALANIIKNPQAYNITLPPIGDQPYLGKVDVGSQIKLADAAKLADMSLGELKQLNPGYSRWTTVPNGPSHLLLPIEKIQAFKEKLSLLPRIRQTSWGRYKIQRGDTLEKIAERYNTSPQLIQRVNRLRKGHPLPHGRVITVPAVSHAIAASTIKDAAEPVTSDNINKISPELLQSNSNSETRPQIKISNLDPAAEQPETTELAKNIERADAASSPVKTKTLSHTIKAGETLSHIAKRNHVSVQQLMTWNNIKGNKVLKPGTKIIIKSSANGSRAHTPKRMAPSNHYIIHKGDTLSRIAKKTGISIAKLKRLNHLRSDALKPGTKIKLS